MLLYAFCRGPWKTSKQVGCKMYTIKWGENTALKNAVISWQPLQYKGQKKSPFISNIWNEKAALSEWHIDYIYFKGQHSSAASL